MAALVLENIHIKKLLKQTKVYFAMINSVIRMCSNYKYIAHCSRSIKSGSKHRKLERHESNSSYGIQYSIVPRQ